MINNREESKTLIVYVLDSHYKFYGLYKERIFIVEDGMLSVFKIDDITGQESNIAQFKTWDYYLIE